MPETSLEHEAGHRGNEFTTFAETNFSVSGASGLYDAARPSYPAEAIQSILSTVGDQSVVVELGSGTGIFTRAFVKAAPRGRISEVWAVEPSEGMRTGFAKKWELEMREESQMENAVTVETRDGLFDSIPFMKDGSANLVVIAQAFHWVGSNGETAIREISRVLAPGGTLALIWNLEDRNQDWVARLRDLYERYEANTPQYRLGLWRSVFDSAEYRDSFAPAEHQVFHRKLPTTEAMVIDRVLSKSFITALTRETQTELSQEILKSLHTSSDREWVDQSTGTFSYPYVTDLFICQKRTQ